MKEEERKNIVESAKIQDTIKNFFKNNSEVKEGVDLTDIAKKLSARRVKVLKEK